MLGVMMSFCGLDERIQPTYKQVADLAGMHPSSARRIAGQLEDIGALVRIGERPVLSAEGVARGGRVVIWSIPKRASQGAGRDIGQASTPSIPGASHIESRRAAEGATLKVERLKPQREHTTGGVAATYPKETCPHLPIDEDGWCTACLSQIDLADVK